MSKKHGYRGGTPRHRISLAIAERRNHIQGEVILVDVKDKHEEPTRHPRDRRHAFRYKITIVRLAPPGEKQR
jgi:hypothetical protein